MLGGLLHVAVGEINLPCSFLGLNISIKASRRRGSFASVLYLSLDFGKTLPMGRRGRSMDEEDCVEMDLLHIAVRGIIGICFAFGVVCS